MLRSHFVAAILAVATPGCFSTTVASPPPERVMPQLAVAPPEPRDGMARVFISTDVPARVTRSAGTLRRREVRELLCETTPCAVTLPYGDHVLSFAGTAEKSRSGETTIHVRSPTEVVNHTLGQSSRTAPEIFGGLAFVAGLGLVTLAACAAAERTEAFSPRDLALGGAASMIGGITLMAAFPGTSQESATTQWSPSREGRVVGAGARFEF